MHHAAWFTVVLLAAAAHGASPGQLAPIFNGKDLSGWKVPDPNPWWSVADGVLVGQSDEKLKGHVLETVATYTDVTVEADVRFSGDIDSGIFIRRPQLQVQIGISRSLRKDMTCSIYARGKYVAQAKNVDKLLKAGDWNTIRIEARGPVFKVFLNGENVLEYADEGFAGAGPIGLQIHPGVKMKVEFRNIRAAAIETSAPAAK